MVRIYSSLSINQTYKKILSFKQGIDTPSTDVNTYLYYEGFGDNASLLLDDSGSYSACDAGKTAFKVHPVLLFSDSAATCFFKKISSPQLSGLVSLDLSDTGLRGDSVETLCKALPLLQQLQSLDVSGCAIGKAGLKAIILSTSRGKLKVLGLRRLGLGGEALRVDHFCRFLTKAQENPVNHPLSIDLSFNPLGEEGFFQIAKTVAASLEEAEIQRQRDGFFSAMARGRPFFLLYINLFNTTDDNISQATPQTANNPLALKHQDKLQEILIKKNPRQWKELRKLKSFFGK